MKIKLDEKHYLNSDSKCWWITRETVVKSGKKAGEITEKNITGWFPHLADVLKEAARHRIKTADIKTVNQLVNTMEDTFTWVTNICNNLEKSLLEKGGEEDGEDRDDSEPLSEFGDEDL